MKINIVMGYTERFRELGSLCEANTRKYCEKHGYGIIVERTGFDTSRPVNWSKLRFILKNIENADWTMWLDADAFIMNYDIKIEDIIQRFQSYTMIAGIHWTYFPKGEATIHSGAFLVRNCQFIKKYLTECYNDTDLVQHNMVQMEEAALYSHYHTYKLHNQIALTKLETFCTSPPYVCKRIGGTTEYKNGHFILHISNPLPYTKRVDYAKDILSGYNNEQENSGSYRLQ